MELENRKRGREEEKNDFEKNAKKQEHMGFDDYNFFKISDSSFNSLEVFDFPWLKENLVNEDVWKFDDVFSAAAIDITSESDELYRTPILIEIPSEKLEDESWLFDGDQIDGVDCIWSSVLNQPISIGPRKVSNG